MWRSLRCWRLGQQRQNLAFPIAQFGQYRWRQRRARLGKELGETAGDGRPEERLALAHGADHAHHLLLIGALEHVAARPRPHGRKDRLVVLEHGHHDHADVGAGCCDGPRRVDAVHVWHLDVHEHHVGLQSLHLLDRLAAGGRLADHLQPGNGAKQSA